MSSKKTVDFKAEVSNLVIFFRCSEFFRESRYFCNKGCGSTGSLSQSLGEWWSCKFAII